MKSWIIYQHVRRDNGKSYIGLTCKTLNERWEEHVKASETGSKLPFHSAIRITSKDVWEHIILREDITSREEAEELEVKFIKELKTRTNECGYNCTIGGMGNRGTTVSEETRKKISNASRGIKKPKEFGDKIRQRLLGQTRSEETKQKLSKARKGIPLSENQKQKISEGQTGRKDSIETRNKKIAILNNEKSKESRAIAQSTKEYKLLRSEIAKKAWIDPEAKKKRCEAIKAGIAKRKQAILEQNLKEEEQLDGLQVI